MKKQKTNKQKGEPAAWLAGAPARDAQQQPCRPTRGALERMIKIYGWLKDGTYPNRPRIARDLVVSRRTAARDIEFMRDRWDLPIAYNAERNGFYFTQQVERLPWMQVTEAELFILCIAQKALDLYQGMPFQKPLELAIAKMTRSLDDQERYTLENLDLAFSFRPFAPEDPDLHLFELVTRAVAQGHGLKFGYRKPGQKQAEARNVRPYHVVQFEGRLYLLAHDPARGEVRTFALGRMSELEETAERFVRPKDFDPKKEFSTSLGVMTGKGDYNVVIEMDAWLTDILRGRRFHPSQIIEEIPGGGSHLRLRLSCLEEIEQYVLSWGTHATVVAPDALRKRLLSTTEELWGRYGGDAVVQDQRAAA